MAVSRALLIWGDEVDLARRCGSGRGDLRGVVGVGVTERWMVLGRTWPHPPANRKLHGRESEMEVGAGGVEWLAALTPPACPLSFTHFPRGIGNAPPRPCPSGMSVGRIRTLTCRRDGDAGEAGGAGGASCRHGEEVMPVPARCGMSPPLLRPRISTSRLHNARMAGLGVFVVRLMSRTFLRRHRLAVDDFL